MNKLMIAGLFSRPVAYQTVVAKAFGSVKLALLWSQLYYWSDKGSDPDGWIYKTQAEIYDETALSRKEQETARKFGIELGVMEEKVAGKPPTVHFKINIQAAFDIVESFLEKSHMGQLSLIKEKKTKPASSIQYLKEIPDEDMKEISKKYGVSEKFILARAEDVIDYCEAKGKNYRDYKAALRNFIKTHLERHPEAKQQSSERKKLEEEKKYIEKSEPRTPEEQARINKRLNEIRSTLSKKFGIK